ncbi:MAG TPA: hypothetical protein VG899_08940 [Mycobacteriales bacterium]|nr:hypothetical protein [Mycobacteriales bacterium]HWA66477.1 hypothetical protein [Mycobacteriales bacterium]
MNHDEPLEISAGLAAYELEIRRDSPLLAQAFDRWEPVSQSAPSAPRGRSRRSFKRESGARIWHDTVTVLPA